MQIGIDSFAAAISDPATGLTLSPVKRIHHLLDYAIVVFDEEIDEMGNYVADLLQRGAGVRPARRASLALEVDAEPCGTTRINVSRKPNTNSSRITGNL